MNEWMNHPAMKNIDPIKLELIKTAARQTEGKSGKALAPVMMALITNANKRGIRFSPRCRDAKQTCIAILYSFPSRAYRCDEDSGRPAPAFPLGEGVARRRRMRYCAQKSSRETTSSDLASLGHLPLRGRLIRPKRNDEKQWFRRKPVSDKNEQRYPQNGRFCV